MRGKEVQGSFYVSSVNCQHLKRQMMLISDALCNEYFYFVIYIHINLWYKLAHNLP